AARSTGTCAATSSSSSERDDLRPASDSGRDDERVPHDGRTGVDPGPGPARPQRAAVLDVQGVDRAVEGAGEDDVVRDRGAAEDGQRKPSLPGHAAVARV